MFPLQFLFDPVPTTTSVVFHRVNGPSYGSIPKKLVVWFLYLVPVLSLVTSVAFVFPHTHCKSTSIGLSTNSPTCCVWIFIGSPNNCPSPHHPYTCRPTISNLFYLLHQTPFYFFPYALVVLLVSVGEICVWFSSGFSSYLFSVSLRMSPDGGLNHVMVSKCLLTLSFSISFSSSTTLFVRSSILFSWSIMISTSCSIANCFNISLSSFAPSFFSITAIFCLTYHTCQYPTTSILAFS